MFDPFNDFDTAGYLRNVRKDKDDEKIKNFEHVLFRANLQDAITFLSGQDHLTYSDFLEVHHILFSAYYPWAGQDRSTTMPTSLVAKAGIFFSHPLDAKLAIDEGLRIGQIREAITSKPGEVMGLFAYGHPFLDGNGRTMLIVHSELCYRAGFSIDWSKTTKADYLDALSKEIKNPTPGILDSYLLPFKTDRLGRHDWGKNFFAIKGLDGMDIEQENHVEGDLSDAVVMEKYRKFEQQRGYTYTSHTQETQSLAVIWNAIPSDGIQVGVIKAISEIEVIQDIGRGQYVVWDRAKLTGAEIEIDKEVTITASGEVQLPRPKDKGLTP